MNNRLVIIDAGHGGSDPGAIGNNLKEKDLTLKIAQYINKRLQELGIDSILTRDSDISLPKNERVALIKNISSNNPNAILISNHINAGGGEGAEVVYSLKNDSTLANLILDNIGEAGQLKRTVYQRRLPENPNQDYYYILRETGNVEPILVEYGFIDNSKDANKLTNNLEKYAEATVKAIAEYLGVPYTNIVEDYYIVQKGDTLYSISKRFNISIDDLKKINNLTTNVLSIGQQLLLKPQDNQIEEYDTYIIKKGDSLWKISKEYGITVDELIKLNNLDTTTIGIGDSLIVPKKAIEDPVQKEYIVKPGDTLWSIAKNNNVSVDELKQKNNLTSNLLSIGQVLIIP